VPGFGAWISGLVPANIMRAAADGAMLPLIVFALLFGLALARVDASIRGAAVGFFRAIVDAMGVIVRWILLAAPVGAFALAVTVATHLGNATAHVILFYLVSHAALLTFVGGLLYVVIPLMTHTPVKRFARALAPAQVVVVSTRSSLAALPAMLDGSTRVLGIAPSISGVVLPLSVSLLRANTGLSWIVYALFLGKLYGVPLGFLQLLGVGAVGIAMSFSVPGIPSGGLLIATPYFSAVGLPPQGIGVLIALDAIPDIFKTLVIVMSDISVTMLLASDEDARDKGKGMGGPLPPSSFPPSAAKDEEHGTAEAQARPQKIELDRLLHVQHRERNEH
jgi:Na+/H+-dicarboxylate symporter